MSTPHLARIDLYPIKSLDGVSVQQTSLLPSGAIMGDRRFALFDAQDRLINGKRTAKIHQIRTHFTPDLAVVTLQSNQQSPVSFHLPQGKAALEDWFSQYFDQPVYLRENRDMGFPDDTASPGPTVISTATLAAIAAWYPPLTAADIRQRLRTNLEIEGVPAFWEDRLFSASGVPVGFQIGNVRLEGINPCQRCVVPTRDPQTGEAIPQFQKIFAHQRSQNLPNWAARSRFNHFYRVAINTRLAPDATERWLQVGDRIFTEIDD